MSEIASKVAKRWHGNIKCYLEEQLQLPYPITEPQEEVLNAIPIAMKERKPIYIASGHSLGKDFLGGCIANWFLDTCIPSKVVLTAPTDRQVKYIMWAETMTRYNGKKIKQGNPLNEPYIEMRKGEWFLIGFTTKESAGSGGGKFQGIRSAFNQCILVTEAQSVEDNIYDQIDGIATGENVLIVFMGNPTRTDGRFAKGLKDRKNNIVFHFSCLDSPNVKSRSIIIPGLVTYEWVEDKRLRWGEGDPRWVSRVLGQVPNQSINKLFGPDVMSKMQERHGFLARFSFNRGVAVDSAGEGMDDNVFMAGSGGEVTDVYTTATIAPSVAAIKAVEMCKACSGNFIIVDCDGIGIGVWQELSKFSEQYLSGIQIIKFHGSSAAFDTTDAGPGKEKKRIYANKRAEAAFIARERGIKGAAAANIKDDYLCEELEADEWFENKSGQIQLIEKKDIKEKLDPPRSPGRADCWKMLQWAFEQNFKELVYAPVSQQMQRVADDNFSNTRGTGQEDVSNLQQYGD